MHAKLESSISIDANPTDSSKSATEVGNFLKNDDVAKAPGHATSLDAFLTAKPLPTGLQPFAANNKKKINQVIVFTSKVSCLLNR